MTVGECRLVRGRGAYRGKQGLEYFEGVSAESAGATGLCLNRLVLAPGARAEPHLHEEHESAVLGSGFHVSIEHDRLTALGDDGRGLVYRDEGTG